ncbi:MAG: hypothetical protein ACOCQO_03475 [Halanaerobiaceae bacterium]
MRKKYGFFILIFIILLAGSLVTLLNYFYSFDYLYNSLIKRDFAINPRVEIVSEKEYLVKIWHYPFYRNINERDEKEFFKLLQEEVSDIYPNIKLVVGELSYSSGHDEMKNAIKEGNPPDIYFNLTNYDFIDEELQIAVSPYINDQEKKYFYSINWNKISHRDKLWGWPVLVDRQKWLTTKASNINFTETNFLEQISNLDNNYLHLNYNDEILLKQLIPLVGLDTFKLEKDGKLDIDSYRALEDIFYFIEYLREQGIIAKDIENMPDKFIKSFMEGNAQIIGPINPYLNYYFVKNRGSSVKAIYLDRLKKNYYLNVFRQKKYQGDDHSKAVMEVARIFTQNLSRILAEELGMQAAYMSDISTGVFPQVQTVIEIGPEVRDYWEEELMPLWLQFWQEELSAEDVMKKLEK